MDAGVQHGQQGIEDLAPYAGAPARHAVQPSQDDSAHDVRIKLRPDPSCVAQEHVALELRLLFAGQTPVLERPEVRRYAVYRLVELSELLDHSARGAHGLSG